VFGRAARFGLRGHGLSLAMMVLAAIRFACPSGHAVAPGLTNRRTPRPSPWPDVWFVDADPQTWSW